MNTPADPSPEPPRDPSVPGPREGADRWAAPGGSEPTSHGDGPGPGWAPGYGDPYAAPTTGPYTGPAGGGRDPYGSGGPFGPGTAGWAPKPGVVPLRPLALGEILDGAVTYIRRHPRVVLGTSAVLAVVAHLIGVPLRELFAPDVPVPSGPTADLADIGNVVSAQASASVPLSVVTGLATTVLTGLLMVVVSRSVLGAPVDGAEAWRAARPRLLGLVGVTLLTGLLAGLVAVVGMVPGFLLLAVGAGPVAVAVLVLGAIAGLVAAAAVWVGLSLAPAVYVLEGGGVVDALRRSWALVKPRFWPVLGVTALAWLIANVASVIVAAPLALLAGAAAGFSSAGATTGLLAVLLGALGGIVAMTLVTPFQAGVTGLLYVDQRMRREGFDIELQRAATFGS